jgi:1,2-diacylglycerol 3-beta-glucosyltransferase
MTTTDFHLLTGLYSALTAVVISVGLGYFLVWSFLGVRVLKAAAATARPPGTSPDQHTWHVFALIPCLNEERVIGATVQALVAGAPLHAIVIDDASDDATGQIAATIGGEHVTVVRRELPRARLGKGSALNHGLQLIRADVARRRLDPARVIICVMDADGRLSQDALTHILPLFEDPVIGGVQVAVQIRRNGRLITRMQDFEFWGLSAVSQFGRHHSATVSLGGNGQFTRLSALMTVSEQPWGSCMTEDLELAIDLLLAGWRIDTTPHAWVTQQAVDTYRALIRQRARWFQGHMSCARHLPAIWRNPRLSSLAVLELTLYLGVPWLLVLPWSIMFHIGILQTVLAFHSGGTALLGRTTTVQVIAAVVMYLVSFGPNLIAGCLYHLRARHTESRIGLLHALVLAHGLVVWNYVAYLACWRAVTRLLRRRKVWDKTIRSIEAPAGRFAPSLAAPLAQIRPTDAERTPTTEPSTVLHG